MTISARVFAAMYDRMMASSEEAGLRDIRRRALAGARGRTLEIGAGTGLNLELYPEAVTEMVLTEPEEPMSRRLRAKVGDRASVVDAPADDLPFEDDAFDTVVATLVLCTVPDSQAALGEIARVLAPDGQLLFVEHVRSEDAGLARWQDRLRPLWGVVGHGCRPNRDTAADLRSAGFTVQLEHGKLPKAAPIIQPMITGVALPPG